jgi:hypothetical protein
LVGTGTFHRCRWFPRPREERRIRASKKTAAGNPGPVRARNMSGFSSPVSATGCVLNDNSSNCVVCRSPGLVPFAHAPIAWQPRAKAPTDFQSIRNRQGAALVGFKGNLLRQHDVACDKIALGNEAPACTRLASFVQLIGIHNDAMTNAVSFSGIAEPVSNRVCRPHWGRQAGKKSASNKARSENSGTEAGRRKA